MRAVLTLAALALLLAATLATPAQAQGTPYAVSVWVEPVDESTYRELHRITYTSGGPIRWSLRAPPGGMLLGATDDQGRALDATVSDGIVSVRSTATGTDRHFTLEYRNVPEKSGPFLILTASVAAASDSPTRAELTLPDAYRRVGSRASDDATLSADGVYRGTGPLHAEFVVLPASLPFGTPDPRVGGGVVLREGEATLTESGGKLLLHVVYDTDHYSPDWRLLVPANMTPVAVHTPVGPVDFALDAREITFKLPYPTGYGMRARAFTVEYALEAPERHGGGYLRARLGVPAGAGDYVTLNATLEGEALVHTGTRLNGAAALGPLSYVGRGPVAVTVGMLAPPRQGEVRVEEGAYVVQVDEALAAQARVVARNASELLPTVAGHVGGDRIDRPFYVVYTDAPVFEWEEGFYVDSLNAISIRASELRDVEGNGPWKRPVSTLIHETAHGLLDRMLPEAPESLSFLDEGLARLAETHAETHFADQIFDCEEIGRRTSCTRNSARPAAEGEKGVEAFHEAGTAFDTAWSAATASEADRGFLYDYSGLVFHAYERRTTPGALRDALLHIAATAGAENGTRSLETITLDALVAQAPGLALADILYPGRAAAAYDSPTFRACMTPLLAPPYSWETGAVGTRPASGCGDLDLRAAAGPAPPTRGGEAPPAPPTPPAFEELPPPPAEEPALAQPVPDEGSAPAGRGGVAPGAVADGAQPGTIAVPAPGLLVVAGALGMLALFRRR